MSHTIICEPTLMALQSPHLRASQPASSSLTMETLAPEGLAGLENLLEARGVGGDGRVGLEDGAGQVHGEPGLGHVEEDGVHFPVQRGDERLEGVVGGVEVLADVGVVHRHEVRQLVLGELLPVLFWVLGVGVMGQMGGRRREV